jgi:hypothetical protein
MAGFEQAFFQESANLLIVFDQENFHFNHSARSSRAMRALTRGR